MKLCWIIGATLLSTASFAEDTLAPNAGCGPNNKGPYQVGAVCPSPPPRVEMSPPVPAVERPARFIQDTEIHDLLARIYSIQAQTLITLKEMQTVNQSAQGTKTVSTTCLWEDKVFTMGAVSHNKVCDIDQLGKSVPEWIDIPSDVSGPR